MIKKFILSMVHLGFVGWLLAPALGQVNPRTFAILEEHSVSPNTGFTNGVSYTVPAGKQAKISSFFCELRPGGVPANQAQAAWLVLPTTTLTIPPTTAAGFNPVDCLNSDSATTVIQINAVTLHLLPGDRAGVFFANFGTTNSIFINLGAFVYEYDYP